MYKIQGLLQKVGEVFKNIWVLEIQTPTQGVSTGEPLLDQSHNSPEVRKILVGSVSNPNSTIFGGMRYAFVPSGSRYWHYNKLLLEDLGGVDAFKQ